MTRGTRQFIIVSALSTWSTLTAAQAADPPPALPADPPPAQPASESAPAAPAAPVAATTAASAEPAAPSPTDLELLTMGEEIVVVASRVAEKRLDAPVTVELVTEHDLRTAGGASYLSALSRVKGIDFSDAGISDTKIAARGFATQFNSRLLMMVDGRLAQSPGVGLPQNNQLPTSALDMKSIEVVVGPASALYGPNAHTGVLNIATKTPWDDSGATISVKGGSRSLFDTAARVAGTVKDRFGWKLNGQYLRGNEFRPDRAAGTHDYGTANYEGDLISGDYDTHVAKGDATLYYQHGDWLASAGTGLSDFTGLSLTGSGRTYLRNWQTQYQVAQVSSPHLYAQVTRTASDAGSSYQVDRVAQLVAAAGGVPAEPAALQAIRDSAVVIDESSMVDSELQLRYKLGEIRATLGGQARRYMPRSGGTYLDDRDSAIKFTEAGVYAQLDTLLFDKLRLAAAARVDSHSFYETQISPKATVQYEVAPAHKVRVGYNRAFKSPTVIENFLRINNVLLGNRTGFTIRDADDNIVNEIDPLRPEQVDALEVGYKGAIGDLVYIDAVAHQSWYRDFISALTSMANPAAATPTFASYRGGMRTAAGTPAEGTLISYVNFGRAKVRGVDVGVDVKPIPQVTVSASVSLLDLVSFDNDNDVQRDLQLNAPTRKLRASVQVEDLPLRNMFGRIDGRYHNRYAFESGYWNSNTLLGHDVPARAVTDITVGYRLPSRGLTFTGTVANVLDDAAPDLLGGPVVGRFAWLQVTYDFKGLRY